MPSAARHLLYRRNQILRARKKQILRFAQDDPVYSGIHLPGNRPAATAGAKLGHHGTESSGEG